MNSYRPSTQATRANPSAFSWLGSMHSGQVSPTTSDKWSKTVTYATNTHQLSQCCLSSNLIFPVNHGKKLGTDTFDFNRRSTSWSSTITEIMSSINSRVRLWKNKPLGSWMYFLWILRVVCFPVKHSCLYNKMKQIGLKIHGCPILLIIYRITDWFGISNSELSVTSVASSHKCPSYCLHLNWPLRGSSLECINFCLYNYSRFWISVYKSRRVHRWWCVWWQY